MVEDLQEPELNIDQTIVDYVDKTTATNPEENKVCEDANKTPVSVEQDLGEICSNDICSVDRTEYENCLDDKNQSQHGDVDGLNEKISNGQRIKTGSKSLELFYIENFANLETSDSSGGEPPANVNFDNEPSKKFSSENSFQSYEVEDNANSIVDSNNFISNDAEDNDSSKNAGSDVSNNRNSSNHNGSVSSSNITNTVSNHKNSKNSGKGLWEITKALNAYDWYMSQSSLDELSCIEEEGTVEEESSEQSVNEGDVSKNERLKPQVEKNESSNGKTFREKDCFDHNSPLDEMSNEQGLQKGSFAKNKSTGKELNEHQAEKLNVQEKRNHHRSGEGGYNDVELHNGLNKQRILKRGPEIEELINGHQDIDDQRNGLEENSVEEEDSEVDESSWETDEEIEGSGDEEVDQIEGGGSEGRRRKVYFNDSREYNADENISDDEETEKPRTGQRNDKGDIRMSFNSSRKYDDEEKDDDSYEETSEYSSEDEMSESSVEQQKVEIKKLK